MFERMRANLDAVASQTGMGEAFRLRGVDVYRVTRSRGGRAGGPRRRRRARRPGDRPLSTTSCAASRSAPTTTTRRASPCRRSTTSSASRHAILLVADERGDRLFARGRQRLPGVAGRARRSRSGTGSSGSPPSAARSSACRTSPAAAPCAPPCARASRTGAAGCPAARSRCRVSPDAQSAAAVPLVLRGRLTGALYLESDRAGPLRRPQRAAAADRRRPPRDRARAARRRAPRRTRGGRARAAERGRRRLRRRGADRGHLLPGRRQRVRGRRVPRQGRAGTHPVAAARRARPRRPHRRSPTASCASTSRSACRPGNDNLEARLLVLRRRLDAAGCGIALRRTGRGRLELSVAGAAQLTEVPTTGPMRR